MFGKSVDGQTFTTVLELSQVLDGYRSEFDPKLREHKWDSTAVLSCTRQLTCVDQPCQERENLNF